MNKFKDSVSNSLMGISISDAHEQEICVMCKQPISDRIYSEMGIREYEISGLCEVCWDNIFKESDENA